MTTRKQFFIATCRDCLTDQGRLDMPFYEEGERDEWAAAHEGGTGHTVDRSQQWRDLSRSLAEDTDWFTPPAEESPPGGFAPGDVLAIQTQPDPVEQLLCVGGPRHGSQVEVAAGANQWFDIEHAQSYRRQIFFAGSSHPLVGRPQTMWQRAALLWEGVADPNEAIMLLANWCYGQWIEQAGTRANVTFNPVPPQPTNGGGAPQ